MPYTQDRSVKNARQFLLVIAGAIVLLFVLSAVFDKPASPKSDAARNPPRPRSSVDQQVEAGDWKRDPYYQCVRKGVAYFQEMGSFPYLSDGRKSMNVAEERCERSLKAFSSPTEENLGSAPVIVAVAPTMPTETEEAVRCTQRGIDHYTERKSFPILPDGRRALDLISLTCQRSPYSF